jgi:hypothetical protein
MFSKKHKVFFQITAQGIKFNRIVASTALKIKCGFRQQQKNYKATQAWNV